MIIEILAAAAGTIAFSILFGVPGKHYPFCGLIGSISWIVYRLIQAGNGQAIATLIAAMATVFLARLLAVRHQCPAIIFMIPGLFPLIPGAGVYWTVYYLVDEQLDLALKNGYATAKVAVAIVLGIVFMFELPQKLFLFLAHPRKK